MRIPEFSIPLWFDEKVDADALLTEGIDVSIPRWFDTNNINYTHIDMPESFNSTMVQLKSEVKKLFVIDKAFSIPQWFDNNGIWNLN